MTNISPGLTWCENYTELIIHNPLPHDSVCKESACNAGDPSSISGLGRSAGERTGYPLQYSWAYFVAQLEKNQLAMQETWVHSLGWEDPLEKGKATHSSILAWRIPWTIHGLYSPWGCKESDMIERLSLSLSLQFTLELLLLQISLVTSFAWITREL